MAIKMKRGTTESWTFGPELADFGRSSTKGKDSVIRAEGIELEMYVYTTSANEWWEKVPGTTNRPTDKIPGLPIDFGIKEQDASKTYRLVVDFEGPEDCALELLGWDGTLVQPDYSNGPYIDNAYKSSGMVSGFVKWPAEKVDVVVPVPVKIRVSYREVGAYDELEEGQLGLEYTEDGQVKLKVGMPNISKWNELPYIEHPIGKYGDPNMNFAHIVGNGQDAEHLSNAHTLDWEGNAWFQGNIYVGGTGQEDPTAQKIPTQKEVLLLTAQTLTSSQKNQVQKNLGLDTTLELLSDLTIAFMLKGIAYRTLTGITWKAWIESGKAPAFVQTDAVGDIIDTETGYPITIELGPDHNSGHIAATNAIRDQAIYIAYDLS